MADVIPFPAHCRTQPSPDIPDCPFQADAEMRLRLAQQAIRAVARQEGCTLNDAWADACRGADRLLEEASALYRWALVQREP